MSLAFALRQGYDSRMHRPALAPLLALAILGCGSSGANSEPAAHQDASAEVDSGIRTDADKPDSAVDADAPSPEASIDSTAPDASPGCFPIPACDASPPDPGAPAPWKHSIQTPITVAQGAPRHRGRDQFYNPGDAQWIIGKFAYGLADDDLVDEDVDIYLLRNCGNSWEHVGTVATTDEGGHATVEGVEDTGGRVFFEIPTASQLGVGKHRVHMVVRGDLSTADLFIEIVPPGTPTFVSDLDGTLTPSDTEEYATLLTGTVSDAVPDSAAALQQLAAHGYHPYYLTARPEWLTARSREFLSVRGYPPGILHTSPTFTGAVGSAAATFKAADLDFLVKRGIRPIYGFGNADTDATAYHAAAIAPDHAIFYQFTDATYGSRRIEAYAELLGEFAALPDLCP